MSILKVAILGHPVLRLIAEPVTEDELKSEEFQRLVEDMIETMHEYDGVGLAAPQVHVSKRMFVAEVDCPGRNPETEPLEIMVVVNPVITAITDDHLYTFEGCLSIPGLHGKVGRPSQVMLNGLDRNGNKITLQIEGIYAAIVQHETDHLDGKIYLEQMDDLQTLCYDDEYARFWAGEGNGTDKDGDQ